MADEDISRRIIMFGIPAGLVGALIAWGPDTDAPAKSSPPTKGTPSLEEVQLRTKGFTVGLPMAATRITVFFDPRCPHCGKMWDELKPLLKLVRFTWVPVGLVAPQSAGQASAILAAEDPVGAMEAHKKALLNHQPGIAVSDRPDVLATVRQNTEMLERLGASSVPYLIGRNLKTGAVVAVPGGMAVQGVAIKFGVALD